jgi:hypothetical protein
MCRSGEWRRCRGAAGRLVGAGAGRNAQQESSEHAHKAGALLPFSHCHRQTRSAAPWLAKYCHHQQQ